MSKTIAIIATLLLTMAVSVGPAKAQADISISMSDADYSFGQHITFHLQATASTTITQVNLFFTIQGQDDTTAIPIPIEPETTVAVDYAHSLVGQNIPPFASLTYWWELHDQAGGRTRSEEKSLYYADNRHPWQYVEKEEKDVHWGVYWVMGDIVFGQTALNIAVKSLDEIHQRQKGPVPGDIRIYIYPNEQDLRSALNLSGYDWAGGQARPELNAILIGIPNTLMAPGEMERYIPHELSHLMVYHATGRKLGIVPPWLDEGLASLYERRPDPNRQALLDQALDQGNLIPLEALCAPFPIDANRARLAYAQSASVVGYLRKEYGDQGIHDLLMAYADNAGCEEGVIRVLGKNLKGLESAWRADLTHQGQVVTAFQENSVWIALLTLTGLLSLPFLGLRSKPDRFS